MSVRKPNTNVGAEGRDDFDVAGRVLVSMRGMGTAVAGEFLEKCNADEIESLAACGSLVEDWELAQKAKAEEVEQTVSSPDPPKVGGIVTKIIGEIQSRLEQEKQSESEPVETEPVETAELTAADETEPAEIDEDPVEDETETADTADPIENESVAEEPAEN